MGKSQKMKLGRVRIGEIMVKKKKMNMMVEMELFPKK